MEIANLLGRERKQHIRGELFNMLNPPSEFSLSKKSAVITIHALEQLGKNHESLLQTLVDAGPGIVVHCEPIVEFYDEDNMFDYLAKWYSQKRNYLEGFWPALKKLEKDGKIEIMQAHRPALGGVFHEASLIVWKPL